ncbi:MAG: hypothetical protein LBH92_08295 [Bacteroidales bacterium]|nr:hypothetical protein [Bacteroidales bacterium]
MSVALACSIIDAIKNGTLPLIFANDEDYLVKSFILHRKAFNIIPISDKKSRIIELMIDILFYS